MPERTKVASETYHSGQLALELMSFNLPATRPRPPLARGGWRFVLVVCWPPPSRLSSRPFGTVRRSTGGPARPSPAESLFSRLPQIACISLFGAAFKRPRSQRLGDGRGPGLQVRCWPSRAGRGSNDLRGKVVGMRSAGVQPNDLRIGGTVATMTGPVKVSYGHVDSPRSARWPERPLVLCSGDLHAESVSANRGGATEVTINHVPARPMANDQK